MDLTALFRVSYGMYVVSARQGERLNGQIANTMFQITSEPPTIAVSLNKQNLTHDFVAQSRSFSVAVLSEETPMTYIGQFGFKSGRDIDKFSGTEFREGTTGAPIPLPYALAALEAEVVGELDCGTHTLFLGKLVNAEVLSQGQPMTYAYYHTIKGGKSPKTAPTYIKTDSIPASKGRYKCSVCGYVYDEASSDASGTPFAKLSAEWNCPVCGVDKSHFSKENTAAN